MHDNPLLGHISLSASFTRFLRYVIRNVFYRCSTVSTVVCVTHAPFFRVILSANVET